MKDDPISQTDAQLTRWLDNVPGAMPPENLNPQEVARQRADAEAVAALLRRYVPSSVEPPYPDFFNSQVLKKIRHEEYDGHVAPEAASAGGFWSQLSSWLRNPWLAGAATAAVVIAAMATFQASGPLDAASGTRVLSVFSPEPNATAHVQSAHDHSAVIIIVDGLEAYPDDRAVVGLLNDDAHPLLAVHHP